MARFVLIDDFRTASGTYLAGMILDETHDVDGLARNGAALVPYTAEQDPILAAYAIQRRGNAPVSLWAMLAAGGQSALAASLTIRALEYWVDSQSGDDRNDGTPARPLRTLASVWARIPYWIRHPVTINLVGRSTRYRWANPGRRLYDENVVLRSVAVTELAMGTLQEGTTTTSLVTAGSLVADAFLGKTFEVQAGAGIGNKKTIRGHDTATVIPVRGLTAAAANDTWRITEPQVEIEIPATPVPILASTRFSGLQSAGPYSLNLTGNLSGFEFSTTVGGVIFENLRFVQEGGSASFFELIGMRTVFMGCELGMTAGFNLIADSTSIVFAGMDAGNLGSSPSPYFEAERRGWTDNAQKLSGWGLRSNAQSAGLARVQRLVGYVAIDGMTARCENSAQWLIYGGVFKAPSNGAALLVYRSGSFNIRPGTAGPVPTRFVRAGAAVGDQTIQVFHDGRVRLESYLIEHTGRGVAIDVGTHPSGVGPLPGALALDGSNGTINAPDYAIAARNGARVAVRVAPTVTLTGALGHEAQLATFAGNVDTTPNASSTVAALTAALGNVVVNGNDDGTVIQAV